MPSCPANVRETKIAFGFKPQVDLPTANVASEMWSLTKTNTTVLETTLATETDAQDIGKGDEFAMTVFKTSSSTAVPIEKYATSEFLAWLFPFALGKATKSGAVANGFTYAAVPQDPTVDCIEMKPFTYAEQIRAEPASVEDREAIGMVVNDFTLTLSSGPGRANFRAVANCVGTGKLTIPSGLTPWPAVTPEHLLNANGGTKLIVNGIDYLLGGNFISLEFRWNNNLRMDSGYYPGSGTFNGFGIRGRMEFGTREPSLTFVARAQQGSLEFNNLINQVEGPTEVIVQGAAVGTGFHQMHLLFPRTMQGAVVNGDADGLVTIQSTVQILKPTDGVTPLCTLSATTTQDGILGL